MRGVSITGVVCAALVLCSLTPPSVSVAQEYTFAPQLVASEGVLELSVLSQSTENTQGNSKTTSTGTFFREALDLAADGYVYHPRFQIFMTKLSGVLSEGISSGSTDGTSDSSRSTTTSLNYELRTIFLPEHPYNLELFTLYRKDTEPVAFSQGQSGAVSESGAIFKYKQVPYFCTASYDDITLESTDNRTDTQTYRVMGSYHSNVVTHAAAYSHSVSESLFDVSNTRDIASYSNTIRGKDIFSLDSRVNEIVTDQQKPLTTDFQRRTFTWEEQLANSLPWNFSSIITYGYENETERTGADQADQPNQEQVNRSTNASLNLSHHLYRSLVSNFSMNQMTLTSADGEMSSRSEMLTSVYSKAIPSGRFTAGVQYSTAEADRQGTPTIIDEVHNVAVLGSFTLNLQNITLSTIVIQVKDPATGTLMTLPQSNYVVSQPGASIQITITGVSPATPQTDPAYAYEFHVSYSLSDQSKIVMVTQGFSLRMDLWDNLLSPYYSYLSSNQEVVSGSVAGGPDRNAVDTIGLASQYGPYMGVIERQRTTSRLNPSETWKTTAQYQGPIAANTNFSTLLSYIRTDYFAVSSSDGTTAASRMERWGADVKLDKRFPLSNLNLFIAGSYYITRSAVDSTTLSINSYLIWQLGLLSVNAGALISRSETIQSDTNVVLASQYYYVTLTRKLF
jgi:hypothetical protein